MKYKGWNGDEKVKYILIKLNIGQEISDVDFLNTL